MPRTTTSLLVTLGPLLVILLACLAYLPSLDNGLVSDDLVLVSTLPKDPGLGHAARVLGLDDWVPDGRALRGLTLLLDQRRGGGDPRTFHETNVLLHVLASLLVLLVGRAVGLSPLGALVAALLFAVHPAASEAVLFVTARKDVLATIFVLLGLLAAIGHGNKRGKLRVALVVFLFVLAVLGKEVAAVFPLLVLLLDGLSGKGGDPRCGSLRERLLVAFRRRPALHVTLAFLFLAALVVAVFGQRISARAVPGGAGWYGGLPQHVRLAVAVVGQYLWLLAVPLRLSADYAPLSLEIPTSVGSFSFLLPFFLGLVVLASGVVLYRRGRPEGFFLLFVLVALAPVAQIVPHHEILSEHNLYLPAVGLCWLVGSGLALLGTRVPCLATVATVLILSGLCTRTVLRAPDWRSMETLVASTLEVHPRCARALYNRSQIALSRGDEEGARGDLLAAVDAARAAPPGTDRMFSPAQNELGLLEYMAWVRNGRKAGDPRLLSAETRLREAVEAGKNDKPRILNLATVLLSSGKIRDAEALLEAHVDAELEALGTSWEGRLSDLSTRLLSLSLQPILRRASEGAGGGSSPSASLLAIRAAACLLLAEETGAADVEGTVGTRARSLLESVLLAAGEPEAAYLLVKGGSREEKGRLPEIRRAVRRRMGRTKAERREVLTGLEGETGLGAGEDRGLLVLFGSKERSAAALERITRNTRLALAARKRGYREEAVAALSRAREALGLDTIAVAAGPP